MSLIETIQGAFPAKKIDCFGKGGLLMSSFPYLLLPAILLLGNQIVWSHAWFIMAIIYTILPLVDEIFSHDIINPNESQRKQLEKNDIFFKSCLYLSMILDWYFFFTALNYFSNFEFTIHSTFNLIGLLFIFSNLEAVQFAVAHQVFHKLGYWSRIIGTIHMSKNLYMHFTYEHIYGHHRRVGTPEDPATSVLGQSLYEFLPITFIGSYKSVYKMQRDIDHKPFYLNYAVLSVAGGIAFTGLIFYFYNIQATVLFLIEALFSIVYLEAINYIEHYGLQRKKLQNGEYEKVTIRHSWNAPHRFSNYLLFKLQRHSDHHQNATKPYQTLLSLDDSPHMPHGYSLIIFMSFFPSVWFSVMDPLVKQYQKIGVGTVQNEVTLKAMRDTRKFAIKLGGSVLLMYLVSLAL